MLYAHHVQWVCKEVQEFIDLGREDFIIPFIVDGVPHSENPEKECYPLALRSLTKNRDILGINVNEVGKDAASVKVISTMFNIRFDVLWQRFRRKKKYKKHFLTTILLLIFIISAFLGLYLYSQNKSIKINLAKAIAERVVNLSSDDSYTASMLALELLDKYPYTAESEYALRLSSSRKTGILLGHTEETTTACFSPDNNYIISGSWDGTIIIWDANSGVKLQELTPFDHKDEGIHTQKVFDISCSPDGKKFAAAYYDGKIRIWNLQTHRMEKELKGHTFLSQSVSYSNDGRFIASGGMDDTVRLWDARSGKEICTFKGHTNSVKCVSWSPDDKYIVSASADGT